ncbi:MAG: alpha/beta hydrolase [Oscillospiraceae bacterium]|jgi:pimeloyl-ACP methyl ester carboxylesterase|nr:alpha/beta hydrolase [Oscillospiraceae bacterium]
MDGFVTVNGHKVHYVEYGSGKPVFNIHGYEVDHRMMTGALEPIFERREGYRRIYVDLPGFGQTPGVGLSSTDDWLSLLDGVIDVLIGREEKFLLTGQSYGCYLMLGLIALRGAQIDGTLFLVPCTIAKRAPRQLPVKAVVEEDHEFSKEMAPEDYKLLTRWSCVVNKTTWRIFARDMKPGIDIQDVDYVCWIEKNGYESAGEKDFLTIQHSAPSCWITARQDHYVGFKDAFRFMDNFDRATYVCMDAAGHNVHFEKEEIFRLLVEDWLYRVGHVQPFVYDRDFVVYPTNP